MPRALFCLLIALLCCGCVQRVGALVSAAAEAGYSPAGQTYALELLPGQPQENVALTASVMEQMRQPLEDMGYVRAEPPAQPQTLIRMYWFSTGPHPVYRTVLRDDGIGRFRYRPWDRRAVLVVEEQYHRFFVIEALQHPPQDKTVLSAFMSPEQALHELPGAPTRLVWRVVVESRGNLARAERVLPELAAAAAPWMGKAALVRVVVQGDSVRVTGGE